MTISKARAARVYLVVTPLGDRLIRATSGQQAIRHATVGDFEARVASQDDLIHHMSNGVEVEDAQEQPITE